MIMIAINIRQRQIARMFSLENSLDLMVDV